VSEISEKFLQDPDIKAAFIRKLDAEARSHLAEASHWDAETATIEQLVERNELSLKIDRIGKAEVLSSDDYHHVYRFQKAVDAGSVQSAQARINYWVREAEAKGETTAFELVFTSPGGAVVDGMAFFDYLLELRARGHHVTTVVRGMAASMAGILLQAGDVRVMGAESWILIHQVQAGILGSYGELADRMEWLKKVQDRILDIFAARTGDKCSRASLKRNWERTDWWIDSREALRLGLVDEIR